MGTTSNFNLFYPEPDDAVASYPGPQRTSQETIDTLLKQLNDMTDGATANNIANALVRRSPSGSANFASLWVAGVPTNTGSVVNKQYADAGDQATLNSAKSDATSKANAAEAAAKAHADGRTPPITVDTSVGTRVTVGSTVVFADTGWRNISSLITFHTDYIDVSGSPTPTFIVRRTLNEVEFRLEFRARSGQLPSTVPVIASGVPAGFRFQFMRDVLLDGSNFTGTIGMINGSGSTIAGRVTTNGAGRLVWGSGRYPTADLWPSAPLGIPA